MKLFEVFQKYNPSYLVVHFVDDGIDYVYQGLTCSSYRIFINSDVGRIQKKGCYRHVYLRKEDKKNDS